ncbi:MAG: monofunctional biosynthetic peptidoglycan transglycosylase [Deltaproteobacteria bacterium]|nr:monofunctional biosynthetic peptidoglycan transglycosylase [Deltaproteobacteria bacterium]
MKRLVITSLLASLIVGLAFHEYSALPDVTPLRKKNPRTTALMELRDQEYRTKVTRPVRQQSWASYDAVSEHLKRAILISEDAAFFSHKGVDLFELKEAIKEDWEEGKFKRGASTITMQLARNLYLSPSKNPLRKIREIIITWQLENSLSKRRIFELYLNVVEWGPGIYGAEAAARHYFSKSARDLDPEEAATLAALLPSPRNPREKGLLYRRNLILTRLAKIGYIGEEEFLRAKNLPLWHKHESKPNDSPGSDRPEETPEESWPGI